MTGEGKCSPFLLKKSIKVQERMTNNQRIYGAYLGKNTITQKYIRIRPMQGGLKLLIN